MSSPTIITKDAEVGRVLTPILVESLSDILRVEDGHLAPEQVRRIEIPNALVDTGATYLSLPTSMIQQLGLKFVQERVGVTTAGPRKSNVFGSVRLTIQGRACPLDVAEVPEGTPVLVGQVPLENLDLVPFPREGKLLPNPEHGGEWMFEMY